MIGSGNISSYGSHEHTVTRCLHGSHDIKPKSGGSMSGGSGGAAVKASEGKPESFSFTGWLSDGWKGLVSKSFGLLGRIWNDREPDVPKGVGGKNAVWSPGERMETDYGVEHAAAGAAGQTAGMAVVATLAGTVAGTVAGGKAEIEKDDAGKKAVTVVEGMSGSQSDGAEEAADGRRWKEQAEVRKLLKQLERQAVKIKQIWNEKEGTEEEEAGAPERDAMDFVMGDSSYLLDSYDRSGEYSTLAKDRSMEGKFRTKA